MTPRLCKTLVAATGLAVACFLQGCEDIYRAVASLSACLYSIESGKEGYPGRNRIFALQPGCSVKETHVSGTATSTSRAAATTDTVGATIAAMGIIVSCLCACACSLELGCLAHCCLRRESIGEGEKLRDRDLWRCVQHCHYCITPSGPDECAQLKCASFCAAREGADCMRTDERDGSVEVPLPEPGEGSTLEKPQAPMTTPKELCGFVQHCAGGGL